LLFGQPSKEAIVSSTVPSAAEALAITESEVNKVSAKILDDIVEKIHSAATSLKTDSSISLSGRDMNAAEHVIQILRSTGYEVKSENMNDPREGSFAVIHFSWARAKK